jgi:GLPGLI family protein
MGYLTRLIYNSMEMKNQICILFLLVLFCLPALGQKKLSEGTISYDIMINTGSEKPKVADFLDGATSTVYLNGKKSRTEMVSSLGTQSTIIDGNRNTITILKEYGEQKYLIQMTPANWKEANRKYEQVSFEFTDETKTILGYKSKKAIGTLGDGTKFTVWYTTELVPENKDFQYPNRSLPGLAMQYETSMGNVTVVYTVSRISFNPVPAARFDLPKSGYRILSYEESKGQ